jgi:peptide chain release factor 3
VDFKGVFDRESNQVHLFERTVGGMFRAPVKVKGIEDESVRDALPPLVYARVCEELELLEGGGSAFSFEQIRHGQLTPVFYGSAMNNFGVQMMLDRFLELAPPPAPRMSGDEIISPDTPGFSGFVFKIQANMNPRHRDHVAFIRIVSGCFQRDMTAFNTRTGARLRLGNSQRLFAQERETVNEAWAGDVVGLVGNYDFLIGDTLADDPKVKFDEMPRFAPECFAFLHNENTAKFKRFRDGLDQLLKEGLAQPFELPDAAVRLEFASWTIVRWLREKNPADAPKPAKGGILPRPNLVTSYDTKLALDAFGNWVALFSDKISAGYFESKNSEKFDISPFPF